VTQTLLTVKRHFRMSSATVQVPTMYTNPSQLYSFLVLCAPQATKIPNYRTTYETCGLRKTMVLHVCARSLSVTKEL
jgi:hypothetical protein